MADNRVSLRKKALRIIGALLGIALIYAVIAQTDVRSLFAQMSLIGFNFLFIIAVTFIAYFMASIAWHQCFLQPLPWSSIWSFFSIRLVGESLAQMNPTSVIAGETLKVVFLKHKLGVSYLDGAMSTLLSRIMIFLSTGILFTFGVAVMFRQLDYGNLRILAAVICAAILMIFLYFIYTLKTRRGLFSAFSGFMKKYFGRVKAVNRIAGHMQDIDSDLVKFYHSRKVNFYIAFSLSILHMIVGSMEYLVIFYALGISVSPLSCFLFGIASMIIRASGFFIPGQLGLEEFGNKIMFSLVSIPGSETWITVSLVRRGRQIFWILAGFAVYLLLSRDIKNEIAQEVHAIED
jgi:uncharacterized protein (TIRG00374 family)